MYRDFPLRPVRRHASQSAALKFIAATVHMGQRRDRRAAGKILRKELRVAGKASNAKAKAKL